MSLSMSGSVAASISCMLAQTLHRVQAEELVISQVSVIVNAQLHQVYMSGMQKSAANKLLQKRNCIPMPMLYKRNILMPMKVTHIFSKGIMIMYNVLGYCYLWLQSFYN